MRILWKANIELEGSRLLRKQALDF